MNRGLTRGAEPHAATLTGGILGNQRIREMQRAVVVVISLAIYAAAHVVRRVAGDGARCEADAVAVRVDAATGAADVARNGAAVQNEGGAILVLTALQVAIDHAHAGALDTLVARNGAAGHSECGIVLDVDGTRTLHAVCGRAHITGKLCVARKCELGADGVIIAEQHDRRPAMTGISADDPASQRCGGIAEQQDAGRRAQCVGVHRLVIGDLTTGHLQLRAIGNANDTAVAHTAAHQRIALNGAAGDFNRGTLAAGIDHAYARRAQTVSVIALQLGCRHHGVARQLE